MIKAFLIVLWFASHPVHETMLSIEYSAQEKIFTGFLKVHYDDFCLDYKLLTGMVPDLDPSGKTELAKEKTGKYLSEKIQVFAGDIKLSSGVSDLNITDNILNVNMFFNCNRKSKLFTVKNSILTDIYKDQANLLIFSYGKFEEGIKLTSDTRQHLFKVN